MEKNSLVLPAFFGNALEPNGGLQRSLKSEKNGSKKKRPIFQWSAFNNLEILAIPQLH